jgi:uncharacterized membrane protein
MHNSSIGTRLSAKVFGHALRPCLARLWGASGPLRSNPEAPSYRPLFIRPRLWKLAVAGLFAFGLQVQAGARAATFITFDPPGSTSTSPSGITPDGVITGWYTDASGVNHGFLRDRDGSITTFDPPGSTNTLATSINSEGVVVGGYCPSGGCTLFTGILGAGARGFLRARDGTFTTFAAPNGGSIYPAIYDGFGPPPAINPAGTVAGTYYVVPSGIEHGFLRTNYGIITPFDPPGSVNTEVLAINPKGTIVGDYCSSGVCYGFLRTPDGTVTDIDVPGGSCGAALPIGGINPAGAIAGAYSDPSCSVGHGFLRTPGGTIITFDPAGSIFTQPSAINPAGAITGYFYPGSTEHGFLRTPDGAIVTFDPPGSFGTFATAINPAGVIIGDFGDANGVYHGFVRFPCGDHEDCENGH